MTLEKETREVPGFQVGDKLLHRFNRDWGPGEVVEIAGNRMRVRFPRIDGTLLFSAEDDAFVPMHLREGVDPSRWADEFHLDLIERLARLEADGAAAWANRLDALALVEVREADGLGSFLGGRIRLFPHQLHVALQATREQPVRWLLADEVGLGKTVEACLILQRLLRTGTAERVIVVAPASLTVQWLGELYRKFHQTFVLLDEARVKDVARELGARFNPFEAHARTVVAMEDLTNGSALAAQAVAAAPDLVVVDEAHHMERAAGHPGTLTYRTLAPLCRAARQLLLLSATPLEADAHGFFRLLELLRPDRFSSWEAFQAALAAAEPVLVCASSTRRDDIGGLPPRVARPVSLPPWEAQQAAERAVLARRPRNALERKRRQDDLERALSHPADEDDPRLAWIVEREAEWRAAGEKILVFVHAIETLAWLKNRIEGATFRRVAVFHEELSPAARDLEVAQFASPGGPTLLVSTEAGGEGRNFEFCRGLVLYDLPWEPALVEQRIGRLDRVSRERPVEIVYFVPAAGFGRSVAEVYGALGVFCEPLGGLDRSLGSVRRALVAALDRDDLILDRDEVVREARAVRALAHRGLYRDLHANRYRAELGAGIMSRVPGNLGALTSRVVREACRQYGFEVVDKPGQDTWYVEYGGEAVVSELHGVPEGGRWLGTFDRAEALSRETLDFFASGHPLVEAVLGEVEDGHRGEVVLLDGVRQGPATVAIVALRKAGPRTERLVFDLDGRSRPEWASTIFDPGREWSDANPSTWPVDPAVWAPRVRALLQPLQSQGRLAGVAGVCFTPDAPDLR